MKSSRSSVSGFTLVEILIVIAIAGILATIAIPSFKGLMERQRVNNASFELFSVLSLARNEAIKRSCDVTVTPKDSWGALTSVDVITDTGCPVGGGVTIDSKLAPKGVSIKSSTAAAAGITFKRSGRTSTTDNSLEIDVAGATSPTPKALCIRVELSGMPRTREGGCP